MDQIYQKQLKCLQLYGIILFQLVHKIGHPNVNIKSIAIAAGVEKIGVDYWFGEINIYNYGDASTSSNGHLLSIIQQDLTKIGCGYSLCSYGPWLVCRYQPSGETFSSPYTISSGETGSQCVNGVNSESGLCK
eukprot:168638_1